jgi:hypothetical protein
MGVFNNKIDYFTNKTLIKYAPFLQAWNGNRDKFYLDTLNKKEFKNRIYLSNFKNVVSNFYMTDNITKNSQIMAECSLFLTTKNNFINNCN